MSFAELLIYGAIVGLGATVFADVIAVARQGWATTHGFYCLVGRWVGSVPRHGLIHANLRTATPVTQEAVLGWAAHIVLGILFGCAFALLFGAAAFEDPKIWQGLIFGLVTVLVPWLVFQPLFGWGIAVSKAPNPWKMRMKSVINHGVFGLGIWLSISLLGRFNSI